MLEIERAMFVRINQDRAANGLGPLQYDEGLAGIARGHALDMRSFRFFDHHSPNTGSLEDRLAAADFPTATARENLAEAFDLNLAQAGLLKSPGHYANLMATDITHVGVGVVRGGAADPRNQLFVQVFARPVPRETDAEAKQRVLERITSGRQQLGRVAPRLEPTLESAAAALLEDLDDEVSQASVRDVSESLLERLGSYPRPLTVIGRRMVASSEYEPERILLDQASVSLGLAAQVKRDEDGGRFLKLLILVSS